MDVKEKAINLFKYIKELYAQRYNVVVDIHYQLWYKFINQIPKDDENILFNFMDRTEDAEETDAEAAIILSIKKPEFESCPALPHSLNKWIEGDWRRYNKVITVKDKIVQSFNGEVSEVLFSDDEIRKRDYIEWNNRRNLWVQRQKKNSENT